MHEVVPTLGLLEDHIPDGNPPYSYTQRPSEVSDICIGIWWNENLEEEENKYHCLI